MKPSLHNVAPGWSLKSASMLTLYTKRQERYNGQSSSAIMDVFNAAWLVYRWWAILQLKYIWCMLNKQHCSSHGSWHSAQPVLCLYCTSILVVLVWAWGLIHDSSRLSKPSKWTCFSPESCSQASIVQLRESFTIWQTCVWSLCLSLLFVFLYSCLLNCFIFLYFVLFSRWPPGWMPPQSRHKRGGLWEWINGDLNTRPECVPAAPHCVCWGNEGWSDEGAGFEGCWRRGDEGTGGGWQ